MRDDAVGRVLWVSGKYAEVAASARARGDSTVPGLSPEASTGAPRGQSSGKGALAPGDVTRVRFHRDMSPVVGDWVRCRQRGADWWIAERLPRTNALSRRERGGFGAQALVANIDRLWICVAPGAQFRSGLVDRLYATARARDIAAALVLNKVDLLDATFGADRLALEAMLAEYAALGLPVFRACGARGEVAELIADATARTVALAGHSGVGKSTLVNALVPGAGRETGTVSSLGKGRHVTTSSRAFPLPGGGLIVDLPGVRVFGLAAMTAAELQRGFPEFAAFSCHFAHCTHIHEPRCGVMSAVWSAWGRRGDVVPAELRALVPTVGGRAGSFGGSTEGANPVAGDDSGREGVWDADSSSEGSAPTAVFPRTTVLPPLARRYGSYRRLFMEIERLEEATPWDHEDD